MRNDQPLGQKLPRAERGGVKEAGILISPKVDFDDGTRVAAGSWKVLPRPAKAATWASTAPTARHTALVRRILAKVQLEDILWEAPKPQQVWFLKQFGANVNLGNIGPHDVIPLECLRLGLRGDTFFDHLPAEMAEGRQIQKTPKSRTTEPLPSRT